MRNLTSVNRLLGRYVYCPQCKRYVRPTILREVQAFPNARPPIPRRYVVRCPRDVCLSTFYVRAPDAYTS